MSQPITYAKAKVVNPEFYKVGTKFDNCDCQIVKIEKDEVTFEVCSIHEEQIKNGKTDWSTLNQLPVIPLQSTITEDDIHVRQQNDDNSDWSVIIDIKSDDAKEALDLRKQILQALQEYPKLKEKSNQIDYLIDYFICDNYSQLLEVLQGNSHRLIDLLEQNLKLKTENEEQLQELRGLREQCRGMDYVCENYERENKQLKQLKQKIESQDFKHRLLHMLTGMMGGYYRTSDEMLKALDEKLQELLKEEST